MGDGLLARLEHAGENPDAGEVWVRVADEPGRERARATDAWKPIECSRTQCIDAVSPSAQNSVATASPPGRALLTDTARTSGPKSDISMSTWWMP